MKPVTIAVSTKEPGLAQDLARGLTGLGKNLIVRIVNPDSGDTDSLEGADVLACDFDFCTADGVSELDLTVVKLDRKPLRISHIYQQIMDAYSESRGGKTGGASGGGTFGSLSLFSMQGGSGVTAVAVTAGRLLAGMYGEKTLYVPMTPEDGSMLYNEPLMTVNQKHQGDVLLKELQYRIKNDRPLYMDRFVGQDEYGLEYLCTGMSSGMWKEMKPEERSKLLWNIAEQGRYQWLILDWGKQTAIPDFGVPAELFSNADSRINCIKRWNGSKPGSGTRSHSHKIQILNHGRKNSAEMVQEGVRAEILQDGESFTPENTENGISYVKISMNKLFSEGVRNLVEILMEDSFPLEVCRITSNGDEI